MSQVAKNCQNCGGEFSDKRFTTCWNCRIKNNNQGKKCSGCRKLIVDKDYPLSRCPTCLEKNRKKYNAKNTNVITKCSFIDEHSVKCKLVRINGKYCAKHQKLIEQNTPDTSPVNKVMIKVKKPSDGKKNISKETSSMGVSSKITDAEIKKILKLKNDKGMTITQICHKTDLSKYYVENVYHGKILPISETNQEDIKNIILEKQAHKEKIKEMKANMSPDEFKATVHRNQAKKMRKISVDDMIKIMLFKKKTVMAAKSMKPRNIFPVEVCKIFKENGNDKVNINTVKNLWEGKTKMYPDDFEDKEITYQEYLDLVSLNRKSLLNA